jgi:CRISPR-associated protein Cas2
MAPERCRYLVSYDVRERARLRRVHGLLRGYGASVQYSTFRCRLSGRQVERMWWELEKLLTAEDALMIAGLCPGCAARIVLRNPRVLWQIEETPRFRIV